MTDIRPARASDEDFILGLAERFSEFPLPTGRDRATVSGGIRADLERHLRERPASSYFCVIEAALDAQADPRAGFVHLQLVDDFYGAGLTCHISDLALVAGYEGRGLARVCSNTARPSPANTGATALPWPYPRATRVRAGCMSASVSARIYCAWASS